MKTKMTRFLGTYLGSICAAMFVGCADSGQGGPGDVESETVIAPAPVVNPSEPGVAPEPGTMPTVSSGYVHETPAIPVPTDPAATAPDADSSPEAAAEPPPQSSANEQGVQRSPEPQTGDDANPDNINPRP